MKKDGFSSEGFVPEYHTKSEYDPDSRIDIHKDDDCSNQAPYDPDKRIESVSKSETNINQFDDNENKDSSGETDSPPKTDEHESTTEQDDPTKKELEDILNDPEKLKKLLEKYPELAERLQKYLDVINDPNASPLEIQKANRELEKLKGYILEAAVKEVLANAGLDVADKQQTMDGETGKTKPDVVATNNTDHPITVFGITVQPGEKISVECKCGKSEYIKNQLKDHIPNQLSGQEGHRVLITTSDINDVPGDLVKQVCEKYNATQIVLDISGSDVMETMKERG